MTESPADDTAGATPGLPYRSDQLAALLEVFSAWSSGSFIQGLAAGTGSRLDATSIVAVTLLSRDGSQRASTLAARLRIGASAISKLGNRLSAQGLVERNPDPLDSRATLLQLTPAGVAAAAVLVEAGDSMMADLMHLWPDEDRAQFDRLIRRFRDDALAQAVHIRDGEELPTPPGKK